MFAKPRRTIPAMACGFTQPLSLFGNIPSPGKSFVTR
jgi:hypothetical protein